MPSLTLQAIAVPNRHVILPSQLDVDPKHTFRPPPTIMEHDQSHGTTRERREWLRQWCLEHPQETIRGAQKAVMEQFGRGMGNGAVIEIMNGARAELDQGKPPDPPPDNTIKLLATLLAGKVEFSVSYGPDGQPSITPKP